MKDLREGMPSMEHWPEYLQALFVLVVLSCIMYSTILSLEGSLAHECSKEFEDTHLVCGYCVKRVVDDAGREYEWWELQPMKPAGEILISPLGLTDTIS